MKANNLKSSLAQSGQQTQSVYSNSGSEKNQDIWQACLEKFLREKYEDIGSKKSDPDISGSNTNKNLHDQIGYFAV